MVPYYGYQISINPEGLPVNYRIPRIEQAIVPPFKAGGIATFSANRVQAVTGKGSVVSGGVSLVPAYGEMRVTVAGKPLTASLGSLGKSYFENLPAGWHPARVEYVKGSCQFDLVVPLSNPRSSALGPFGVLCHEKPWAKIGARLSNVVEHENNWKAA